ncbi:MAG: hypothetical protein COS15_02490 [Caldiserica bacterium CG02_land_8_20_14_3_00_36_38]|nr:hypothetical protein [Caldisericota bacterium]PIP49338.1 MAG: hypothetical protein COX13_04565 [Caldiserica bacterium CG23_combo_of_CG06-09_8_20_14_all_35_60]PIV55989.1 MAG: hypothetical protein COS15_02490 [Caldiserica bacterium CG02_land_8_20_14_3_00_36_38]
MTKKFLILVVLVGLLFTQFPLSATRAKSFASPYELVEEVFKERIDLASSDDMETFIAKAENKKPLLSNLFIDESIGEQTTNELRYWVYGAAEGSGVFEIVKLTPLVRIYRVDEKGDKAVAYVEQFFMYKVKPGKNAVKTTRQIPDDWLVPVDENGAWTAATQDYYTVIMEKTENGWKIEKLIDADIGGTEYSLKIGLIFAGCGIEGFPNPPAEGLPLPPVIEDELYKSSMGYKHSKEKITGESTTQSPYRRAASDYADSHWNDNNTSTVPNSAGYIRFWNDCANFVSQCLYESGGWSKDWYNNGIIEDPNNAPYPSQEWHIVKGTLNSSWSWCRADNLDYYILYNLDYKYGTTASPYGWTESYMDAARGDVITLDKNGEGTADHVGIVVAFDYYTGTPLVDAHDNNQYHTSWKTCGIILHNLRMDYEFERYGAGY